MNDPLDTKIMEQSIEWMEFSQFIESPRYLKFVEEAYRTCVPLDFFIIPASSSGKHHPPYALGIGGLLRHTKAAMVVARNMKPLANFTLDEWDQVFTALALHDIAKPSKLHPIEAKFILEPLEDKYYFVLKAIIPLIESHMGQWDEYGKLPTPQNDLQKFVHLCDFLASRKDITIETNSR